ncbi:MAG: UDP-N-acetylmuramoyl-L-alanine--D-glutamate ligase [Taibaiella sp.]|nr:UDP-N-acetylmuramoyl-L-alanine--D-glutamate ligase [Taibaiella sp.]
MNTANKRLVVLGAAESGVGAALLGKQQGWDVFVSDGGTIKPAFRDTLLQYEIPFEERGHTTANILNAACIVKSPGIPEKAAVMKEVRAAGIEVCSEIEFAYRYKGDSKIIGITGSNGKSTTTLLTWHIFKTEGYDVAMVGNIGYSFARQIFEKPCAWYVIEISSFQLDDIHTFRPDVAVLLNITPDHLDRYDYKFENYVASKFNITRYQREGDFFVVNADDPAINKYITTHQTHAKTIFFTMDDQKITDEGAFIKDQFLFMNHEQENTRTSIHDLSIKGLHNKYNTMAAGISARVANIRTEKLRESLETFKGLEHRLEYVATVRGVEFINDSKGTNVNSVWYALESMAKPVVLILGGQDKGNDYNGILDMVQEKVKAIVCLGINNEPIHSFFDAHVNNIIDTSTAREAVLAAYSLADSGDIVLLSPGCASFDLFANYEDRGTQFKQAVREL